MHIIADQESVYCASTPKDMKAVILVLDLTARNAVPALKHSDLNILVVCAPEGL